MPDIPHSLILHARWVAPIDGPPLRDAAVRIEAGRIVALSSGRAAARARAEVELDLGRCVLLPGLINPHTHLELTCYAGRIDPGPFWPWLARIVELRSTPGAAAYEREAVAAGAAASLEAGVTCVGDISRTGLNVDVLRATVIRKVCFVELISGARQPPASPDDLAGVLEASTGDALLTVGISPHAPYSVRGDAFRAAMVLAARHRCPWTMHLAETREELAWLAADRAALPAELRRFQQLAGIEPPGCPLAAFIDTHLAGAPPGLLAHLNYADQPAIDALARTGHSVVFCPRAHAWFGHRDHPFERMLEAGVSVVFGTDSLASNHSLSVLDELREVYRRSRGRFEPAWLIERATRGAAAALGLAGTVGTIETGRQADLAAFEIDPHTKDPLRELVCEPRPARAVWVAGQQVVGTR